MHEPERIGGLASVFSRLSKYVLLTKPINILDEHVVRQMTQAKCAATMQADDRSSLSKFEPFVLKV